MSKFKIGDRIESNLFNIKGPIVDSNKFDVICIECNNLDSREYYVLKDLKPEYDGTRRYNTVTINVDEVDNYFYLEKYLLKINEFNNDLKELINE